MKTNQEKKSTNTSGSKSVPYTIKKTSNSKVYGDDYTKPNQEIRPQQQNANQKLNQQTRISRTNTKTQNNKQSKTQIQYSLKTVSDPTKNESNSQHGLQSQSTAADKEANNFTDKFNDCESALGGPKQNATFSKDVSIDYKEGGEVNSNQNGSAFKSFSFVSVVMEPSKKNPKSMKARDKNKPLIDIAVVDKQIHFQNKLVEYQKQMNMQSGVEYDELAKDNSPKKRESNKKAKKSQAAIDESNAASKVQRGNLGFCYLDMSLINLCGIPSLWIDQRQYAQSGTYRTVNDTKKEFEPYIKPFQKNLLKKQYKVYTLLRFHKIFENDKYFGKNISLMGNQSHQTIITDYWQFSTENLKESNKYQVHQIKLMQKHQENFDPTCKKLVLNIVQGSNDIIPLDVPKINDPEPAFFKLINAEAKILKQILVSQNINQTDQNDWNLLWTSVTLQQKQQIYEQLHDYQKINHFMNSVELTRKDRFADNIYNMKSKFGHSLFDFMPETYLVPEDQQAFQHRFSYIRNRINNNEDESPQSSGGYREDNLWIYKPSQSSQGKGIYIIQELADLQNTQDKGVVCRYISNPLLVNGHKFDLRIYVLVTSVDPLRIYVYNEGLARFASCPYDHSKSAVKNLYQHLTNYSINKKSDTFQQNKSLEERDHGNKWSMSDLQAHFEKMGIHMQPIWERIYDAIIKSLISVEHHLLAGSKKIQNSSRPQNCFELFGFDIILDSNFKPYILEVNFSPSLSADSPLDYHIKSNLLVDTLNIVGLKKNLKKRAQTKNIGLQRFRGGMNIINNGQAGYLQMIQANQRAREVSKPNLKQDQNNFTNFLAGGNIDQYFLDRLSRISAKHRELVFETLDELQRNKNMNYTCIYPSAGCHQYDKFFEGGGRQSNQLIHKYLYTKNELYSLTKQICDFQKQCQKSKQEDEPLSQSENEDQNEMRSDDEQEGQSISVSSPIKVSKISEHENSENSNSEERCESEKAQKESKQRVPSISKPQQFSKIEIKEVVPAVASGELSIQSKEEFETPLKGGKKIISIQNGTPTKIINFEYNNQSEYESPKKKDIQPPISKQIQLIHIEGEQQEFESPSKVRTHTQQNLIGKHLMKPESMYSPKQPISDQDKKEEEQLIIKENTEAKSKTRNHQTTLLQTKSTNQTQNFTLISNSNIIDKKVEETLPNDKDITQVTQGDQKTEVNRIQIREQQPLSPKLLTSKTINSPVNAINAPKNIIITPVNEDNVSKDQLKDDEPKDDKPEKKKQKMIITGDDILIEYVYRIMRHLESLNIVFQKKYQQSLERVEEIIPQQLKYTLEKFAMHAIWSTKLTITQKQAPIVQRITMRHKEMVDRRTKILTTMLKKQNKEITQNEVHTELRSQDANREKIISRIQSQKIEKMVKQSNVENQIEIVSILVEGQYNLPVFLQVSGGKTSVQGTLSSLKMFEKILKSDKITNLQKNLTLKQPDSQGNNGQRDFMTETKPSRENSQLFVPNIIGNSSNTQLLNKSIIINKHQIQSAHKADLINNNNNMLNHTLNTVLPDSQQKRLINSGSASGYTSTMKNGMGSNMDQNRTQNGIKGGVVSTTNSYIQTGSNEVEDMSAASQKYHSISEGPGQRISRQLMAAVHSKNSQSFISAQQSANQQQQSDGKTFDKRQRSYRNESHMLNMTQNQKNPDQFFNIQKDIQEQIRTTNMQQSGLARKNYTNFNESELNISSHKQMTPQVYNYGKNAYKNTFSPNSNQNPKVSTSAIAIVKAGDLPIKNTSFIEFNRSHQGEGFVRKNQSFKQTTDNYDSIPINGIQDNQQLIQHESKRMSSHSHHTGQGNRGSFKMTSGKYEPHNHMALQNNGILEFNGNIIKQNHTSNNRLMSFDSQQNGARQISTTLHVQPQIGLNKQMQLKTGNALSKQQLNHGITLPQIAQPQNDNLKSGIPGQTSHKELKIKKQI